MMMLRTMMKFLHMLLGGDSGVHMEAPKDDDADKGETIATPNADKASQVRVGDIVWNVVPSSRSKNKGGAYT